VLAAADEPNAFALFYQRHVRALAAYFWRRSRTLRSLSEVVVRKRVSRGLSRLRERLERMER
jgi:hypothetical protein